MVKLTELTRLVFPYELLIEGSLVDDHTGRCSGRRAAYVLKSPAMVLTASSASARLGVLVSSSKP
jgi:hypothetical protein